MRQLKRFALACILIASLSAIAIGGETQGPGSPAPGETSCPPGEVNTPPCFTQDPGEMNAPPGETQGPGSPVTASLFDAEAACALASLAGALL